MYVGMDVHKDMCQIVHVGEDGKVLEEYAMKPNLRNLDKFVRKVPKDAKIAMEAGTSSRPVYRHLRKSGFEVHVAKPDEIKEIAKSKKKTDKHDATVLAQKLRLGYFPEVYIPDEETEAIRTIIRHRVALGQKMAAAKNYIHALLTLNGVENEFSDLFGEKGMRFLEKVKLPQSAQMALDSSLREIGFLREEIESVDVKLAGIAKDDKNVKLLMTIPGVDYYSALAITSEIGDIHRFPDAKKLTSYAGLVVATRKSGKIVRHGRITKEGPEVLRWILICNAHSAVKKDGKLKRSYMRLEKRIGANKAIVATARKILVIIYHMLVNQRPYEERDDDLTYRKLRRMMYKARTGNKRRSKKKTERASELKAKGMEVLKALGGDGQAS